MMIVQHSISSTRVEFLGNKVAVHAVAKRHVWDGLLNRKILSLRTLQKLNFVTVSGLGFRCELDHELASIRQILLSQSS